MITAHPMTAPILAHPGQTVTHQDRPRLLGPTEYFLRCSRCEIATIIVCDAGDVGAGVLCEACLCAVGRQARRGDCVAAA